MSEQDKYRFRWEKAQNTKGGYGNRHKLLCSGCGAVVADVDAGNRAGRAYALHFATQAAQAHQRQGEGAR